MFGAVVAVLLPLLHAARCLFLLSSVSFLLFADNKSPLWSQISFLRVSPGSFSGFSAHKNPLSSIHPSIRPSIPQPGNFLLLLSASLYFIFFTMFSTSPSPPLLINNNWEATQFKFNKQTDNKLLIRHVSLGTKNKKQPQQITNHYLALAQKRKANSQQPTSSDNN